MSGDKADIAAVIAASQHGPHLHPEQLGAGDVVVEAMRWYAPTARPGAHMVWMTVGLVLAAVATRSVYVWIDGVRLVHAHRDLWKDRWGHVAHVRPGGGVLVAGLMQRHGMLVRSSDQHYVVLHGTLVAIDQRVYRHLLQEGRQLEESHPSR